MECPYGVICSLHVSCFATGRVSKCTANCSKWIAPLALILEFMDRGDLYSYLRQRSNPLSPINRSIADNHPGPLT